MDPPKNAVLTGDVEGETEENSRLHDYLSDSSDNVSPANVDHCSINAFLSEAEIVARNDCIGSPPETHPLYIVHDKMRRKLKYYFMNPVDKWRARRKLPFKLFLQVVKILVLTIHLVAFGMLSYRYVLQRQDMKVTLGHIFLEDWTADVVNYPPSDGPYAVYTIPDFYNSMDHVVKQYSKISELAIGSYTYSSIDGSLVPLNLCVKSYVGGSIFPFNSTVNLKNLVKMSCVQIPVLYPSGDPRWENFSVADFLKQSNMTIDFSALITARITFSLKTVFLKSLSRLNVPECYRLNLVVLYDNEQHDGQIPVTLHINSHKLECRIKIDSLRYNVHLGLHRVLDGCVFFVCIVSSILCVRSLYRAQKLRREASTFFIEHFGKKLTFSEVLDFVDCWYIMIVVSDLLVIFGTIMKVRIEERKLEGVYFSQCTMLLGIGNLLLWSGLLRYLGFFPKYNILILTLKRAVPNVMRFMICAILIYAGFAFCGWIVFGPYHIKFRSLSSTLECLFSIMNGDDMFATFALIDTKDSVIWWFNRFYLYSFISLFVYVVISLFISVIMDTFETIKMMYINGSPPKTMLETFLSHESDLPGEMLPCPGNSVNFLKALYLWLKYKFQRSEV